MSTETDYALGYPYTPAQHARQAQYPYSCHAGLCWIHDLTSEQITRLLEAHLVACAPIGYGQRPYLRVDWPARDGSYMGAVAVAEEDYAEAKGLLGQ